MTAALDVVSDYLDWRGFTHVRLDGSTASAERGAIVEQFNEPGTSTLHSPESYHDATEKLSEPTL